MKFFIALGCCFGFLMMASSLLWAARVGEFPIKKDKKFCILEARVGNDGSLDALEIAATCDGDAAVLLESVKLENQDPLKDDLKLFSGAARKLIDEGFKPLNCNSMPPVPNIRRVTRFSCTWVRL